MSNQTAVPHTQIEGELEARQLLRGEWDRAGTVSIYLPAPIADELLSIRGWRRDGRGAWVSPATGDFVWSRDEALARALVAECDVRAAFLRSDQGPLT